jgi:hypothetical protein
VSVNVTESVGTRAPANGQSRENTISRIRLRGTRDREWKRIYVHFQKGRCWLCHHMKPKPDAWHHLDHDPTNWDPSNVRLVHRGCNTTESNLYRISMGKREKISDQTGPSTSISWEASKSLELGPTFELELDRLLAEEESPLTVRETLNRLAKICSCDQQTVSRWLERETTREGKYMLSERTVEDGRRKRTMQFVSHKRPQNAKWEDNPFTHRPSDL